MDLGRCVVVWRYTCSAHDLWCFIQVLRCNFMPVLILDHSSADKLAMVRDMVQHFCTADGNSLRARDCVLSTQDLPSDLAAADLVTAIRTRLRDATVHIRCLADVYGDIAGRQDALTPDAASIMDDLALWADEPDLCIMRPTDDPHALWSWVWPCDADKNFVADAPANDAHDALWRVCGRCDKCEDTCQHWARIYTDIGPPPQVWRYDPTRVTFGPGVALPKPLCPLLPEDMDID